MWDIIIYKNRMGLENVINGWNNQKNFPNKDDQVQINGVRYVVTRRVFDYDKAVVHITVKVLD